jgi:transcriptional antiterminator NusG
MEDENIAHEPEDAPAHDDALAEETLIAHEELDGADPLEEDTGISGGEIHPDEAPSAEPGHVETGHADADQAESDQAESDQPELLPVEEPLQAKAAAAAAHGVPVVEDLSTIKHWYIIHAYSGFEQKVAESLKTRSQAFGFADRLGQILIPTEEVVELRNGKKVTSKRLLYPGYVLVEFEMDDELWHAVKSTPRVTGFVGGGTKPVPLTADEVNSVLYRQASSADRPRPKMNFEKHETVKIVDGPFTNFSGKVDEINPERNTLRVMVTIFGRSTPVELDFLQVEKI